MKNPVYSDDSIFNQEVQTIVNTVNCVGVMGSGIALECRLRYPELFEDYVRLYKNKEVKIGKPYLYKYPNRWILNFPTKRHWKYNSNIRWIEDGLKYLKDNYKKMGITSIALPKLGSDKGGLDWNEVSSLMNEYLKDFDIPVYICLDRLDKPTGIEKEMTDYLNKQKLDELISEMKIKKHIAMKIISSVPLKKFRQLLFIRGVGKKTYETLFTYIYNEVKLDKESLSKKGGQTKLI